MLSNTFAKGEVKQDIEGLDSDPFGLHVASVNFSKDRNFYDAVPFRYLILWTFLQNGCHFSILLLTCKLTRVASFKGKCSFEFRV